ncbi:MAG: N-acetylmuramoyl-L-alanine amidase [Alphaproteobacteria bacterium]|nr:N-acetylmuramoyl-L-alanine amidase [Alphaproteobacteria bacterium]
MELRRVPSPNFAPRAPGSRPVFLILHYTACDLALSLKILTDGQTNNPVSSHYLIAEDGTVFLLVDEEMSAWHAGLSSWGGYIEGSLNTWSIGIELVNFGNHPYTEAQYQSLLTLCPAIQMRHQISPFHVLGHADIAPLRKSDPGHHLDWGRLAERGIGVQPQASIHSQGPLEIRTLQILLARIGYKVTPSGTMDPETSASLRAFCQRCAPTHLHNTFCPEVMAFLDAYARALS